MIGRFRLLVTIRSGISRSSTDNIARIGPGLTVRSKSESIKKKVNETKQETVQVEACGPTVDDDEDDMEDMFVQGPAGMEWGGPTRGGKRPEPTRFGDWERKGRASDF